MAMEHIRKSIETAIEYLSQHPSEARYTDSLATAELEEGLEVFGLVLKEVEDGAISIT